MTIIVKHAKFNLYHKIKKSIHILSQTIILLPMSFQVINCVMFPIKLPK
jgi:hypothetical protein